MNMNTNSKIISKLNKYLDDKFYFFYIVSCMIIIPVSEFVSEIIFEYIYFSQPFFLSVYGYVGICMILISIYTKYTEHKSFHWSDVFTTTLLMFTAISLAFSSKIFISINVGNLMIEEPSHFLAYYSLMFSAFQIKSDKYRKYILYIFLFLSLFNGIIGILQTFDIRLLPHRSDPENRDQVYGLTQNRNYFGGLSVLFVGAISGLYIYNLKKQKIYNSLIIILYIIAFYCSINTFSRLAWVGDVGIFIFLIVSILVMLRKTSKKKIYISMLKRWALIILISFFVVFFSILKTGAIIEKVEEIGKEIESSDFNKIGSYRGYIWRCCLESVPRHWLTGTGLSNIITCFEEHEELYKLKEEDIFRSYRAHNEYVHILTTQGVLSLLNYMLLLIFSIRCAVIRIIYTENENDRLITWVCLTMFSGYLIQGLFNSSVINVAMYFWIVVGLMNPNDRSKLTFEKM